MLELWSQLLVVESDDVLPGVAVSVDAFHGVARTTSCGDVWNEAGADPVPRGLTTPPLKRARRPGQLLAVVDSTNGAKDAITKAAAVRLERGAGGDDLA